MAAPQQNECALLIKHLQNHLQDIQVWQLLHTLKITVYKANKTLELLRFGTDHHLRFPKHNVSALEYDELTKKITVIINFMGLLGSSGILPQYYTELLLKQQRFNNHDLIDFIDTLQQQSIEYYYQAFEKSRIYLYSENYYLGINKTNPVQDLITSVSNATLIGKNEQEMINALLPQFANRIKSVNGLQQVASLCLRTPVKIQEFTKHEVTLAAHQITKLTGQADANNQLSSSFTLGTKIRLDAFHFTIIIQLQSSHRSQYLKYKKIWSQLMSQLVQWYLANTYHYKIKFVFAKGFINILGQDFYLN